MDAFKNAVGMGGGENKPAEGQATEQSSSGGGGFMDKLNSAAGGGKESEAKEDYLDKGQLLLLTTGHVLYLMVTSRHRLSPGEVHGCGTSGQRVCH